MTLYLYGVIAHDSPVNFGPVGFDGATVAALPQGDLAAVIGHPPRGDLKQGTREELVKRLLAHQQTLEQIMKKFFVLPFRFGTTVADEPELAKVLEEKRSFLSDLIGKMRDCSEIDLLATWEVPKILQEISEEDPEIAAFKREIAQGRGDKISIGMLLAEALKKKGDQWRDVITTDLKVHANGVAHHDLLNDEMVLNSSFLISRNKEADFFRRIEEADHEFKQRLCFKCVGPLPPYSFSTLSLRRFDPVAIRGAADLLHLNGRIDLSRLKKTYKELSIARHPDTNPGLDPTAFEQLNQAYRLLSDYCEEGPRSLENAEIEGYVKLQQMQVPETPR